MADMFTFLHSLESFADTDKISDVLSYLFLGYVCLMKGSRC